MADTIQVTRQQLLELLGGGHAHASLIQVVDDFPLEIINTPIPGVPYTPWHLVEHLRIAQWDILEFIRNPDYIAPNWPDDYWPPRVEEADAVRWQKSIAGLESDRKALIEIVKDPKTDLFGDLPHASGYNILREILVASDHNAYHIGELSLLKTIVGAR